MTILIQLLIGLILFALVWCVYIAVLKFYFSPTKLVKHVSAHTGQVKRVYIERKNLQAKLWIQPTSDGFEVGHRGSDGDFTVAVPPNAGEAIHICEAREALRDVGLDMNDCTWDDILQKAVNSE